ncbi:MAG TPA: NAD(P)-dependent oxidoreductase, partial [Ignavibacteriaceae bacterium]|nr:NAD(P)-dependent oxidoreductase [Ignavibacteriaceae bacterium]
MKVYYDQDASLDFLKSKKLVVIGFGSQGHAHSLNLQDSGMNVVVCESNPETKQKAINAGLSVKPVAEAVNWADVVMIL